MNYLLKIKKIIKMMKLYGFVTMFGSYLEGICFRLRGNKSLFVKSRHRFIMKKLMPVYNDVTASNGFTNFNNNIGKDSPIWIMWWQGKANYPEIVKLAIKSIYRNAKCHNVIELCEDNVYDYIDIPSDIRNKFQNGIISITHYSDIIRFALLAKYGGVWMDSTMFMNNPFPDDFYQHSLYSIKREVVNNSYVSCGRWSTYFFACGADCSFPSYCYEFLIQYWRTYNKLIEYTILDYAILLAYNNNTSIKTAIDSIPLNNESCTQLVHMLKNKYDCNHFHLLSKNTFLFKLSWKENFESSVETYTYLDYLKEEVTK